MQPPFGKNPQDPLKEYLVPVKIVFRPCISGEGLRADGACYTCTEGTYLLIPPTVAPTDCKFCPSEKAYCTGGTNIGPRPGYWRKNNETDKFLACQIPGNCLGMYLYDNDKENSPISPVGFCKEGTYGALCNGCMPGYKRSGEFDCKKCPNSMASII